jgi:hypothetical protein
MKGFWMNLCVAFGFATSCFVAVAGATDDETVAPTCPIFLCIGQTAPCPPGERCRLTRIGPLEWTCDCRP